MLELSNQPDDWNSHWEFCDRHKYRYHASEWCHHCQDEEEQEEQEDLIHVELTAKFILYVTIYHGNHDECEMTKVKGAIESFDFSKVINWRDRTDTWGQIFEVGEKLYITITEEEAEMCEVPPQTWWKND